MKKFIALGALVLALGGLGSAFADPAVVTPAGNADARDNGDGTYHVYADGDASNPDPLDGYVGVEINPDAQTITVYCSDEGGWDDVDEDGNPVPREECNPAP